MKTIETTYTITLTPDEIDIITTALHGEYKFIREELQELQKENANNPRTYQRMKAAQTLRNNFADIINRRYCGEDA